MSYRAVAYVAGVITVGLVTWLASFVWFVPNQRDAIGFVFFLVLATLAQLFHARAPNHVNYHVAPVFIFASIILFDTFLFGLIIIVSSLVEQAYLRYKQSDQLRDWYIQPFNIASDIVVGTVAHAIFIWFSNILAATPNLGIVAAGVLAAAVFVFCNHVLLGVALMLARRKRWRETGMLERGAYFSDLMLLLLGFAIAEIWRINPWLVVPALSPLVPMYRALLLPKLEREAATDSKTGLLNPRAFQERFAAEVNRTQRLDRELVLLMCDLDFLRTINNTYGHLAGDTVLSGVARLISEHIRSYDFAARFGGEEFAVVLPETTLADARVIAERIRSAIATHEFRVSTHPAPIYATMSIGIALLPDDATTTETLIHQADIAVYHAKANGRNRVVCTNDLTWEVRVNGIPSQG